MKIKTDDGAIGKSLNTKRTKINDSSEVICVIKAQMAVNRAQFDALAGFAPGQAGAFYNEQGAPIAEMSILLLKRELSVSGKLWRGEQQHISTLPLKKAIATDLRFVLEPNGAAFVCTLKWKAAGDEVDEVKDLLGSMCSIDLTFTDPNAPQGKLELPDTNTQQRGDDGEDTEEAHPA